MSITRDDVLTYIKRSFTKDNIVISIVGCATKEEVSTLLDKYLSKLLSKRSKVRKVSVKSEFGSAESKSIFMDIPQSVILFAQKGIAYEDLNYYNASVLINALGGMSLNSILMKELRQNLGKDLPKGYSKEEVIPDQDVMDTWATSAITKARLYQ